MDPIERLLGLEHLGIKLGLENIRTLCHGLRHPQRSFRSIIVAGTNGKGSVTAMLETALREAGYRTARFTSPHLLRLEERFVIDGRSVAPDTLREVTRHVLTVAEDLRATGELDVHPTFFEATSAIAFELFNRTGVEVAVLEVGLGGRFDATNVVQPSMAVITSIDFDHERHLGRTLSQIAHEKAGVVKEGSLVVTGATHPEALGTIEHVCQSKRARLIHARAAVASRVEMASGTTLLELRTPVRSYGTIRLALRGRHQVDNAVLAVRALESLPSVGLPVSAAAIRSGLETTVWPGRMQMVEIDREHRLWLDAAHNPAGAAALAAYLQEIHPERVPLVFGAMADKNVAGMLARLVPCAARWIMTQASTPRAIPATMLAEHAERVNTAGRVIRIDVEPTPRRALDQAFTDGTTACAAGSIFLIGELLRLLEDVSPPV